jgi:hypothetical protein
LHEESRWQISVNVILKEQRRYGKVCRE